MHRKRKRKIIKDLKKKIYFFCWLNCAHIVVERYFPIRGVFLCCVLFFSFCCSFILFAQFRSIIPDSIQPKHLQEVNIHLFAFKYSILFIIYKFCRFCKTISPWIPYYCMVKYIIQDRFRGTIPRELFSIHSSRTNDNTSERYYILTLDYTAFCTEQSIDVVALLQRKLWSFIAFSTSYFRLLPVFELFIQNALKTLCSVSENGFFEHVVGSFGRYVRVFRWMSF